LHRDPHRGRGVDCVPAIEPPEDYRGQALRLIGAPQSPEERAAVESARHQLDDLATRLQRIIDDVELRHGRTSGVRGLISSPSVLYGDPRGIENKPDAAIEVLLAAEADGLFRDAAGVVTLRWSTPPIDESKGLIEQLWGDYAILAQARSLAFQLAGRMRLAAAQSDPETMVESFDLVLALGRSTSEAGNLVPHMVSLSLVGTALDALHDVVMVAPLDGPTAVSMLSSIDRHLPLHDLPLCIEAERLIGLADGYRQLQQQPPAERLLEFVQMQPGLRPVLTEFDRRTRLLTQPELSVTELFALRVRFEDVDRSSIDMDLGSALRMAPAVLARAAIGHFSLNSSINAARILLAIEIYMHGSGGTPPASLDDLVPGILAEVPADPTAPDGRFRYRLTEPATDPHGRSFLLYTVGMNGADNGGVENPDIKKIDASKWREDDAQQFDAVFNRPSRVAPEILRLLREASPVHPAP